MAGLPWRWGTGPAASPALRAPLPRVNSSHARPLPAGTPWRFTAAAGRPGAATPPWWPGDAPHLGKRAPGSAGRRRSAPSPAVARHFPGTGRGSRAHSGRGATTRAAKRGGGSGALRGAGGAGWPHGLARKAGAAAIGGQQLRELRPARRPTWPARAPDVGASGPRSQGSVPSPLAADLRQTGLPSVPAGATKAAAEPRLLPRPQPRADKFLESRAEQVALAQRPRRP